MWRVVFGNPPKKVSAESSQRVSNKRQKKPFYQDQIFTRPTFGPAITVHRLVIAVAPRRPISEPRKTGLNTSNLQIYRKQTTVVS